MSKEEIEELVDDKMSGLKAYLLCIVAYLNGKYPDFMDTAENMIKKLEKKSLENEKRKKH